MSDRPRMGENTRARDDGEKRSLGERILGASIILGALSLVVLAACAVWFLAVELPEILELGWSAIESADALTRAIEQHGGTL